jgi:hypothetical protein
LNHPCKHELQTIVTQQKTGFMEPTHLWNTLTTRRLNHPCEHEWQTMVTQQKTPTVEHSNYPTLEPPM